MAQTVYDAGDLITSRLSLGVVPDGTSAATVVVTRPDGSAVAGMMPSAWVGSEKTVQFYATDDNTAGGATALSVGDWVATWTVTGTGASVSAKTYNVLALPVANDDRPAWAPTLSQVADHVPWLTVDVTNPAAQTYLGIFTGNTEPSDEQAQRVTDDAISIVGTYVGVVPVTSQAKIYRLAQTAASLRAAAMLARAFPRRREDIDTSALLMTDAITAAAALEEATAAVGADPVNAQPLWYAPDPVAWGDWNL